MVEVTTPKLGLSSALRALPPPGPGARLDQRVTLAANAGTLGLALWQGWSLGALVWPYWAQSVAIGIGNVVRMSRATHFTTDGVRMNGAPVPADARGRGCLALFFSMHYGLFHLVYLMFLLGFARLGAGELRWVLLGALAMAAAQAFATGRQLREDRAQPPNLGTLMALPYLRILPMHLTILLAVPLGQIAGGKLAMLLFGALKAVGDHWGIAIEDAVRRKVLTAATVPGP